MANRPSAGRHLYSDNTKHRVLAELIIGTTQAETARKLNVPQSLCARVRDRFVETGTVENKPMGRPRKLDGKAHDDLVLNAIENPTLTLTELGRSVEPNVSEGTVRKELAEEGIQIQKLREQAQDEYFQNLKDEVSSEDS